MSRGILIEKPLTGSSTKFLNKPTQSAVAKASDAESALGSDGERADVVAHGSATSGNA